MLGGFLRVYDGYRNLVAKLSRMSLDKSEARLTFQRTIWTLKGESKNA